MRGNRAGRRITNEGNKRIANWVFEKCTASVGAGSWSTAAQSAGPAQRRCRNARCLSGNSLLNVSVVSLPSARSDINPIASASCINMAIDCFSLIC